MYSFFLVVTSTTTSDTEWGLQGVARAGQSGGAQDNLAGGGSIGKTGSLILYSCHLVSLTTLVTLTHFGFVPVC